MAMSDTITVITKPQIAQLRGAGSLTEGKLEAEDHQTSHEQAGKCCSPPKNRTMDNINSRVRTGLYTSAEARCSPR